jgi:hypothetical protein
MEHNKMFMRLSLPLLFIAALSSTMHAQTADNNTALHAIPSTQYVSVARLGFATPGDGGLSFYHSSNAACSINSGAGDNGSQVSSADNKCWIADISGIPSIKLWGAKCDSNGLASNGTDDSVAFTAANAAGVGFTVSGKCRINSDIEVGGPVVILPNGQMVVDTGKTITANGNILISSLTPFPNGGVIVSNVSIARSNTIPESPIGNSPQSLSAMSVTATTSTSPNPIQRQYTTQLGTVSNTGRGWSGVLRGSNATRYAGMDCQHGTGWCWADNPLTTLEPATGDYSGIGSEVDLNNLAFPVPDTGAQTADDVAPWVFGTLITGVGDYAASAGLEITGIPRTWQNGLAVTQDSVRGSAIFEGTNADVGYRVLGNHTAAIDTTAMAPGSVRIDSSNIILPGICTSVPAVTFSGSGGAVASAYLGLQNRSTIATTGSGYAVGDKVAFPTTRGASVNLDNAPLANVTSVNGSGGVTGFTFTLRTAQGTSSHTGTIHANDTSMTVPSGAIFAPGDMIYIWLDTLTDAMDRVDAVYVYVTGVTGNTVSFAPSLSQVVHRNNASYSGPIESNTPTVYDFGVRASPGASTVALAGPLAQTATSGSGTGFTLNPVWGVSTFLITNYGAGYASAPTVTIDSAHTACAPQQPTATALLGGYPMVVANSSWLVGRNAAGNGNLRMISTDIYNHVAIGYDGNTNVMNGLSIGVQNLLMSQGELGLSTITASGTAPGAGGVKFEAVCGTTAGTAKIIAYAGTSTTPVTIVDRIGSGFRDAKSREGHLSRSRNDPPGRCPGCSCRKEPRLSSAHADLCEGEYARYLGVLHQNVAKNVFWKLAPVL